MIYCSKNGNLDFNVFVMNNREHTTITYRLYINYNVMETAMLNIIYYVKINSAFEHSFIDNTFRYGM